MRRIFTDFGTEEEAKLFNQIKELQDVIKRERNGYPQLAFNPRNEEEYAMGVKLLNIYTLLTSNQLKEGMKCIISLYNELKDTYNTIK